tara:strand:- start:31 stop:375 length:345 start_codon:yes stop_codon:yes gene_type:complete
MAVLGQAALNLDSPDHSAAQVLAFMHGPEAESKENRAVVAEPKYEDDEDTSMEDMPLATLHDNDRDGVIKIVWTAEEDQQLLQVRPRCLPLVGGSIGSHTEWTQHTPRNMPVRY